MAITRQKKSDILAKLSDALSEATAASFVGFTKLTVADASSMRQNLRKAGIQYYVAKKTLIRKALAEKGYGGTAPELPGEVAIAWTSLEDTTAPAREVYEYGKKLRGAVTLLGGIFEGAFADRDRMTAIATIPPTPVLRGMFVNVINAPIQGLVIALDKIREAKAA
jgi:large subunit ribosomal protein L10